MTKTITYTLRTLALVALLFVGASAVSTSSVSAQCNGGGCKSGGCGGQQMSSCQLKQQLAAAKEAITSVSTNIEACESYVSVLEKKLKRAKGEDATTIEAKIESLNQIITAGDQRLTYLEQAKEQLSKKLKAIKNKTNATKKEEV